MVLSVYMPKVYRGRTCCRSYFGRETCVPVWPKVPGRVGQIPFGRTPQRLAWFPFLRLVALGLFASPLNRTSQGSVRCLLHVLVMIEGKVRPEVVLAERQADRTSCFLGGAGRCWDDGDG